MIISILINGTGGMLKEIIAVKFAVDKFSEIPSWKAICQDTIQVIQRSKILEEFGSEKGEKRRKRRWKVTSKAKIISLFPSQF